MGAWGVGSFENDDAGDWAYRLEEVDEWVAAHAITPPAELAQQAIAVIDRILAPPSELLDLWIESGFEPEWRAAVAELRGRVQRPA
jgi:hypothetical protein